MSYVNIPVANLPNFQKAVISFWFKVPQASIDAVTAAYQTEQTEGGSPTPLQLDGIIPLLTFGQILNAYQITTEITFVQDLVENNWVINDGTPTIASTTTTPDTYLQSIPGDTYQLDQCYIGVDCTGTNQDDPSAAYLRVYLQTPDTADMSNAYFDTKTTFDSPHDILAQFFTDAGQPGVGTIIANVPGDPLIGSTVFYLVDKNYNLTITSNQIDETDIFKNAKNENFGGTSPTIQVFGDKWHHLLLSFDLSGHIDAQGDFDLSGRSISSSCKMWVAFDDVNYTGPDMPTQAVNEAYTSNMLGPNDTVTEHAVDVFETGGSSPSTGTMQVGSDGAITTSANSGQPRATYSYSPTGLPSSGQSLGLPASAQMVDHIKNVEMAEFQMFTGVTLDTGVVSNRRAFITAQGGPVLAIGADPFVLAAAGIPVDPITLSLIGTGTTPAPPINLLRKAPAVAFTTASRNWQTGRNLGSSKNRATPTGKIKALPKPQLGK